MHITGATKHYVQLADPVAHVRFPQLFQPILDELGHDVAVVPLHVHPENLSTTIDALRTWNNAIGCGVTMPHKEAVVEHLDELTRQASLTQAVNAIRRESSGRLIGTMVDGSGFVSGLRANEVDPRGRPTLLVGAGGTARAIAFALAEAGVENLTIANRTAATGEQLASEVALAYPECRVHFGTADPAGKALVINATKLGMKPGDPLPVDAGKIEAGAVVADVVMAPPMTPMLEAAASYGIQVVPGQAMLDAQIPEILDFLSLSR